MRKPIFITYNNKTQSQADWAKELGLNYKTLVSRIKSGRSIEECFSEEKLDRSKLRGQFLTEEQIEFMNGNLLGDGYIRHKSGGNCNALFNFGQKAKNKEYVELTRSRYLPFIESDIYKAKTRRPTSINNKINHDIKNWDGTYLYSYNFTSVCCEQFTLLRNKWYPHGKKIVPRDLKLTWKTLATWYCDDGVNCFCNYNSFVQKLRLCTNGFTTDDVEFLISRLEIDLGLKARLAFSNKKPIITIYNYESRQIKTILEHINPYMPKCFDYKQILLIPSVNNYISGKGVHKIKKRIGKPWVAYGREQNKNKILGFFATEEEALTIRHLWELENPNKPAEFINLLTKDKLKSTDIFKNK